MERPLPLNQFHGRTVRLLEVNEPPAIRVGGSGGAKPHGPPIDVYSADEIARAAGVRARDVWALAEAGRIQPLAGGRYFSAAEAVTAARSFTSGETVAERSLFRPARGLRREPAMPVAASSALHAAMLGLIAFVTSMGMTTTQARTVPEEIKNLRLVFLVSPGPGGGGGGGGLKEPKPPPPAQRKGVEKLHSPVPPVRRHPKPAEVEAKQITPPPRVEPPPVVKPQEPPPVVKADAVQPVFAPVVPTAADPADRTGVPWRPAPPMESADSHGPGTGGGTGSGRGTGIGPGDGSGIGPGSGGGTGGGPYRPGTGITPPSILREVTPDYTDEGRRRAIQGDVVLEIVVRADGSVGSVKTLQGLGYGLDQRAADAVRQWRFNPARRYGTPVDVIVEVAVEFKLR
jgi:periplasmic protein TonB